MNEFINDPNSKNILRLKKQFSSAGPYPHLQIKNFLKKEKALALHKELQKENFKEKESDLFSFKQTDDLYFSRNKLIKRFHSEICSWDFFNLITQVTGKKFKGVLDSAGSLYESSDFLLCHDDKLEGRKIAYIIYLSPDFDKKKGGEFVLFNSKNNKPTAEVKRIPPTFNSLLIFEVSKKSFHEVSENLSNKKKYAIGGWLK